MPQPLVIAYHLIWTAYGWWLPNDPRGCGSRAVCSDIIAELGEHHYGRKHVQPAGHEVRQFYARAAQALAYPLLPFDELARNQIADEFAAVIDCNQYTCYACAIMPDHVHILIRKHKHAAEQMTALLKDASRDRLIAVQQRTTDHPTWTGGDGWSVWLELPREVRRTIGYIERNPLQAGLPAQRWPFVKPYDGWPFHPGHSPHSSYARRLRELDR
jgi:REP element-mobilizing transposase RayT